MTATMRQTFMLEPRLNRIDARYCFLESLPRCNVSVCMAAVLEREVPREDVLAAIERVVAEVSKTEDRLRHVPGALAPPVWVHAGVDPARHVTFTQLRPGAGWDDALRALERRHSTPFEEGVPPWQVECVYGLPAGRTLVLLKLHHALADGVALVAVLSKLFMRELLEEAGIELQTLRAPEARGILPEAVRHWWTAGRNAARDARALWRGDDCAARRRRELEELRDYARGIAYDRSACSSRGRASVLFRIPLGRWKAIAEERGGAVNDLYIAIAAAVVRRTGVELRFRDGPLRIAMPVNARDGGILQPAQNVTETGIMRLDGSDATLHDLRAVRRVAHRAVDKALEGRPTLVDDLLALLPGGLQARLTARRFASTDVMATNLIVPAVCELEGVAAEMVFLIPSVIGPPVSFALGGYDEQLHLAMTVDTGLVPSPAKLARTLGALLDETFGAEHVDHFWP